MKDGKLIKEFTNDFEAAIFATNHMDDKYVVYCNSQEKCKEWIHFVYKEI